MGSPTRSELVQARRRLAALACVLAMLGASLLLLVALNARELGSTIDTLGVGAAPLMIVLGALLIAGLVPPSLVAGASGYALGMVAGTVVGLMGAVLGAVLCAAIGRLVGTPAARAALGERVRRFVTWLDGRPIRAVVVTRLVPGLPFAATSYLLGITRIRFRDNAVGTAIGFSPRCFAYAALGGSLRDLGSPEARAAIGASAVLALLVVLVPRLAMRSRVPIASTLGSSDG